MANAIQANSVQRGYDVADYVLNTFGGAGGQHACLVADALAIGSVLLHPLSGVLSAYGMGLAELRATRSRAVLRLLDVEGLTAAEALAAPLADEAKAELEGQGVARAGIRVSVLAHLRYSAPIAHSPCRSARLPNSSSLELHRAAVRVRRARQAARDRGDGGRGGERRRPARASPAASIASSGTARGRGSSPAARGTRRQLARRARTRRQDRGTGADHRAAADRGGRAGPGRRSSRPRAFAAPRGGAPCGTRSALGGARSVLLEVFAKRFTAIAEEMGDALQNTARSVNIKERLDFSCAIFDGEGGLVANAPHMPVHLGSMDRSVETECSARSARTSGPATCACPTRPITEARICPISPWSRRLPRRRL